MFYSARAHLHTVLSFLLTIPDIAEEIRERSTKQQMAVSTGVNKSALADHLHQFIAIMIQLSGQLEQLEAGIFTKQLMGA